MAYEKKKAVRRKKKPVIVVPRKRVVPKRVKKKTRRSEHERVVEEAGRNFQHAKSGSELTIIGYGRYDAIPRAENYLEKAKNVEEKVPEGAAQRFRELLSSV